MNSVVVGIQVLFIIWIVGGLFGGLWAYVDARHRNMPDPLFWFIIVFLALVVGILIYVALRPKRQETYR